MIFGADGVRNEAPGRSLQCVGDTPSGGLRHSKIRPCCALRLHALRRGERRKFTPAAGASTEGRCEGLTILPSCSALFREAQGSEGSGWTGRTSVEGSRQPMDVVEGPRISRCCRCTGTGRGQQARHLALFSSVRQCPRRSQERAAYLTIRVSREASGPLWNAAWVQIVASRSNNWKNAAPNLSL